MTVKDWSAMLRLTLQQHRVSVTSRQFAGGCSRSVRHKPTDGPGSIQPDKKNKD